MSAWTPSPETADAASLAEEARRLARYLVGSEPPEEVVARYLRAVERLDVTATDARDASLLRFAGRQGWSLPYLDAACALIRPQASLRRRLVVASALLETHPAFVEEFLPRRSRALPLAARIVALGARAALRAMIGLAVYPLAARS